MFIFVQQRRILRIDVLTDLGIWRFKSVGTNIADKKILITMFNMFYLYIFHGVYFPKYHKSKLQC